MITVYTGRTGAVMSTLIPPEHPIPAGVVWIDLLSPSRNEEEFIEQELGIDIPTHEEMREIEVSSRLYHRPYRDGLVLYMTAPLVVNAESSQPQNAPITFILAAPYLITVRYATPQSFRMFASRTERESGLCISAETTVLNLWGAIIDRVADILERVDSDIDSVSQQVFDSAANGKNEADNGYREILRHLGRSGDLASKASEALVGMSRLVAFFAAHYEDVMDQDQRQIVKTLNKDIRSLTDHAGYTSGKLTFLLDATLGMINIQQNTIIKIFSVVTFVFLPPTLIASIYGMNFKMLPELEWQFGYPLALCMMVVSAILPYLFFRRRGWL
ncbi:MAG: magnesium transporter CorA family protein [Alphaproteobacteria bacterium]